MTAATDTASPPTDAARHLATLPTLLGMRTDTYVRSVLHATTAELSVWIADGALDVLTVAGERWFVAEQVRDLVLAAAERRASSTVAALDPTRDALVGYLDNVAATGDYADARDGLRPLVCARAGRVTVRGPLDGRAVVLPVAGVARWAGAQADAAVRALPTGPTLADYLLTLPGVSMQANVTPALGSRRSHRVRGWVRIDPARYVVRLPDELVVALGGGR